MFHSVFFRGNVAKKYEPFYSGNIAERIAQGKAVDELLENGAQPHDSWAVTYMLGTSLKSGESLPSTFEQFKQLLNAHMLYVTKEQAVYQGPEDAALGEANRSYRLLDKFACNVSSRKALISDFTTLLQSTQDAKKAREEFLKQHSPS